MQFRTSPPSSPHDLRFGPRGSARRTTITRARCRAERTLAMAQSGSIGRRSRRREGEEGEGIRAHAAPCCAALRSGREPPITEGYEEERRELGKKVAERGKGDATRPCTYVLDHSLLRLLFSVTPLHFLRFQRRVWLMVIIGALKARSELREPDVLGSLGPRSGRGRRKAWESPLVYPSVACDPGHAGAASSRMADLAAASARQPWARNARRGTRRTPVMNACCRILG